MKREHLIVVALAIFISFGVFVAIKQGQSANDQAQENQSKISDLESQMQDLEYSRR